MRTFTGTIAPYLRKRGFDGFDLDFQYPGRRGSRPSDKSRFTILVTVSVAFTVHVFVYHKHQPGKATYQLIINTYIIRSSIGLFPKIKRTYKYKLIQNGVEERTRLYWTYLYKYVATSVSLIYLIV